MICLDKLIPFLQIIFVIGQIVLVGCTWDTDDSVPVDCITLLLTSLGLSCITTLLWGMLVLEKSLEKTAHLTIALSAAITMYVSSILATCALLPNGVDSKHRAVGVAMSGMCYICTVLDMFKFVLNKTRYMAIQSDFL